MKRFFHKLVKFLAYFAAGGIILLAVAVGLFRLLLPRLPAYQDDIKGWATAAIGMEVEFSGMNARWRFSGPELNFYNAELVLPGDDGGAFAADEVSIGIDLMRLVVDRALVVDSVLVRDSMVNLREDETGAWRIQNIPIASLGKRFAGGGGGGEITVIAEDFDVSYEHPENNERFEFVVSNMQMTRSSTRLLVDAIVELPESLGNRLSLGLVERQGPSADGRVWQLSIDSRDLNLAGWSNLQPVTLPPITSGRADVSLSVEQSGSAIRNAVMEFDIEDLVAGDGEQPFGAEGLVEFHGDDNAWLVVANDIRMLTQRGTWPESSFNLQGALDTDGQLRALTGNASFLDLDDLAQLKPWLPSDITDYFAQYQPSGRIENLTLALTELTTSPLGYDIAMELSNAGVLATERLPGVRGLTGSVRANRSGGRVELDSTGVELNLEKWLEEGVFLDRAHGTVIWRRNQDEIIVLSDSVALENADLTSRSNVQLSLPADGSSPVLDLESRWTVSDLNAAGRYLPSGLIKPTLYQWLQSALVAGSIPSGTTRFSGPLDRFPFDNDEGVFRVEARLADATLRYSDKWPDVENLNLDMVVDRTRLYSEKNTATNAGNSVVDAKIEIADLREPVLTIDSLSTGTVESIRQFARQSPISDVFGGRLDDVSVSGDAAFTLKLTYPIRQREDYTFATRIQLSDAGIRIEGFTAPVTELNGVVVISRDDIGAESLFGRFMGEPVNIDLRSAGTDAPGYSVVANVDGRFTAGGLSATFGLPLEGIVDGASDYFATVNFPRGGSDTPSPMFITIDSDLRGTGISLPAPLAKQADESLTMSAAILFPGEGTIDTRGRLGDGIQWDLGFQNDAAGWDFDRGVLALGGAAPGAATTRGLHVAGDLSTLKLSDWLSINTPAGGKRGGLASRIRSLDLNVQDLYVLGQHFREHRVLLDRSSNDWLVTLEGAQAQGSLSIPYDFTSGRTLSLEMERLILPGSDEESEGTAFDTDPRELPPLSINAAEFAFGKRHLGRVTAEFTRTPDGLVAEQVQAEDKTFTIDGAARWVIDTEEPGGQRTWVSARLASSDVEATMQRLDSTPGIVSKDMEIDFDVSWPGGPREDFLDGLDGSVTVRFGAGQLDEVEPGAGRMFGLMSVVALPRRLALDFRDVLDKGFAFDEITGTFRLEDGDAFTCDLSLKGPAADVGIVGRAGLQEKDYSQSAIVSANVGNTLPVVGAVVAGPQVAAALLIFSQIFKKPLQEMGQVYYAIDGSWDAPQVDSANAARFASNGRDAGCLEAQN